MYYNDYKVDKTKKYYKILCYDDDSYFRNEQEFKEGLNICENMYDEEDGSFIGLSFDDEDTVLSHMLKSQMMLLLLHIILFINIMHLLLY